MLQLAGDTPDAAAAGAKVVHADRDGAREERARSRRRAEPDEHLPQDVARRGASKLMPNFNMSQYLERAEAPPGRQRQRHGAGVPEGGRPGDCVDAARRPQDLPALARRSTRRRAHAAEARSSTRTSRSTARPLTGAKEQRPRWKRCVDATDSDLGEALGKVYVERTFGADGKARTLADGPGDRGRARRPTSRRSPGCRTRPRRRPRPSCAPSPTRSATPIAGATTRRSRIVRGDAYGNSQRANAFELPPAAGQDRQARRQDRVADDAADRQRVLQPAREQHQLPGRHPAAAVLHQGRRRRGELRRGRRGRRPRADARLRRPGPPLRRGRQPARLVDAGRRQGVRGARRLRRPSSTAATPRWPT